jgi:hypothetical protein
MKKPQLSTKGETLARWTSLPENLPLNPAVVPYKHEGSTYCEDGIRITGSRQWIEAVLSHLKPLLAHEGTTTRLAVSLSEATDRETRAPLGTWSCYIQVHERGREAKIANTILGGLYDRELGRK